jgi:HD-like signal output (HDOD) protein
MTAHQPIVSSPTAKPTPKQPKAEGTPRREADLTMEYLLRRMKHKSDFPALSTSMSRVQNLAQSDTDNMQTLCDEVLQDVALTQKLLRLVNTAHFRRAGTDPISTVSRAVALIGAGGVRNLAMSLMLLDRMEDKVHAKQLKAEFLRTVMAGTIASELSSSPRQAEQAYLAAMFRNLGRLLVHFYLPEDAEQIRAQCVPLAKGGPGLDERQAALRVLGVGMDQLGDKVAEMWGLAPELRAAMLDPGSDLPRRDLHGQPDFLRWLASVSNEATDCLMHSDPAALGDSLMAVQGRYAMPLNLRGTVLQDAAGRSRKRLTELTQALPREVEVERLLDAYYVDTPPNQPVQVEVPAASAGGQAISVAEDTSPHLRTAVNSNRTPDGFADSAYVKTVVGRPDDELGLPPQMPAVATPMPLPDQTVANVLTNGIQDLTNTLLETFKLNDVLQVVLETIYRGLECQCVVFCLRDPRSNQLLGRLAIGEDADIVKAAFKVPLTPVAGQPPDLFSVVCLKHADLLIDDASEAGIRAKLPNWYLKHVGAPTFLLLPLVLKRKGQGDVVLGLIYADRGEAGTFQVRDRELSLLRTLRNQALMAFKQTTGQ